ncbi:MULTISPECIES: DUF7521 family protein [Haloferax]|uniref:Uncharacterized protein n=2 Tax=Haloferax gibbonsii TaxID=35746 RepID=A0A0K1IU79_HALGI|nr:MULTISPECIES: hypothetical protein [Haloferax]AKU08107.1 hypothetical protein ABY42_10265 [Haloferax gibbonsii]ELZ79975.1 hypothetical protein C454_12263 [Haloferax gibbonsii ATCC 33959]RDZ52747.1 hypothetical protein C5C07_13375 [Haloferax sp. Atlit-4N]REA02073.1 hypothetical protein DEQ92_14335 [Haloferax sp. Atlit-6N]
MQPLQIDLLTLPIRYVTLFAAFFVTIVMGLFIVFQAYHGYRRNANRRMLFLAVGLAFVTVIPPLMSLATASFGLHVDIYMFYLPLGTAISQIVGLSFIIYSLALRSGS